MYRSPHKRHGVNGKLERKYSKNNQKPIENPDFKVMKKPRRVNKGYKMSYRYKYYMNQPEDETEDSDEIDS